MAKTPALRPSKTTSLTSGMIFVLIGLATFALSRGRDGFDRGLFQGATIGLMVFGAYLLGSATFRKSTDEELGDDAWLPSRDKH